jgi:PPOX class probable F420-dependent enzyme
MSDEEIRAFIAEGTRTGLLANVRKDGSPHVAPVWFVLDEHGTVIFNTGRNTIKGKSLRRDPRVSMAIDDPHPPYSYVRIDGTVSLSENLEEMLPWSIRIAARYMGDDQAEAYGKRNAVEGEMLCRLTPTKVVGFKNVSG